MIESNVIKINACWAKRATVYYVTSIKDSGAPKIHLGSFIEARAEKYGALGMVARTSLRDSEARLVGQVMRRRLGNPFQYLMEEFEEIIADAPDGDALTRLCARHGPALWFNEPEPLKLPKKKRNESLSEEWLRQVILTLLAEERATFRATNEITGDRADQLREVIEGLTVAA